MYEILIDNKLYDEFNVLQQMAKAEGWYRAIVDGKDSYFITVLIDNVPAFSFTAIKINQHTIRIVTKLYSNPRFRNNVKLSLWKSIIDDCVNLFDSPMFHWAKLKIITRHPSLSNWKSMYRKRGWIVEEDSLYQIGNDKTSSTAWKQIYYSGDISLLQRLSMSQQKYREVFGPYNFTQNWSKPAIENAQAIITSPKNCLEIGTFEGRFAVWLAENYNCRVTTIDPFDGSLYNVPQVLFNEAKKNCIHNIKISNCPITLYQDTSLNVLKKLNEKFDFIYIDGSHKASDVLQDLVLSYSLLNKGGVILLDDSVYWKARDHITREFIQDVVESPRIAVDSFIHIHWKDIEVLKLPNNYQTAFRKLND